ncbi:hypothetical protein BDV96DRAFT_305823 [Lophiotrema nucula]|uniref:FAD-binding domain-containing protein n=1 Tax=Lophiotrema nucula TaxID=690887 RepID=A0A6A5YK68_9PLEO|nr:hypothetical protein BDV96DRAFT_305823 [Lophiotrema nucula]
MDVAIVGAGVAGLGAAIALRRAGHTVTIYEKSHFRNEIGAAILITPNGNRILRHWGFDFEKARPVDFKQFRWCDGSAGGQLEVKASTSFEDVEEKFGERMCAYHRVDLHSGLKEVALAERDGWARPAEIKLGCEVVRVEPEKGELQLKSGEVVKSDFVVLADGCHTPFLPQIAQEDIPTVKVGKSVARCLAPFEKVLEHPDAKKIWGPNLEEPAGFVSLYNKGIFVVTYPCRDQKLLNVAIFHDTRPDEQFKDGWQSDTTIEKVLETLDGCHDMVRHIPQTAEMIKVYTVTQRPPSTTIYRGRILCIGDTTHHMLPTHAQGGCSSLEDAAALEVLFSPNYSKPFSYSEANLEKRLHLFQHLRLPRSATTQILSSLNPQLTMEGLKSKNAEIRKFYKGELPNWPFGTGPWGPVLREFFYDYDVFKETEGALNGWDEESGIVEEGSFRWFGDIDGRGGVAELSTMG